MDNLIWISPVVSSLQFNVAEHHRQSRGVEGGKQSDDTAFETAARRSLTNH